MVLLDEIRLSAPYESLTGRERCKRFFNLVFNRHTEPPIKSNFVDRINARHDTRRLRKIILLSSLFSILSHSERCTMRLNSQNTVLGSLMLELACVVLVYSASYWATVAKSPLVHRLVIGVIFTDIIVLSVMVSPSPTMQMSSRNLASLVMLCTISALLPMKVDVVICALLLSYSMYGNYYRMIFQSTVSSNGTEFYNTEPLNRPVVPASKSAMLGVLIQSLIVLLDGACLHFYNEHSRDCLFLYWTAKVRTSYQQRKHQAKLDQLKQLIFPALPLIGKTDEKATTYGQGRKITAHAESDVALGPTALVCVRLLGLDRLVEQSVATTAGVANDSDTTDNSDDAFPGEVDRSCSVTRLSSLLADFYGKLDQLTQSSRCQMTPGGVSHNTYWALKLAHTGDNQTRHGPVHDAVYFGLCACRLVKRWKQRARLQHGKQIGQQVVGVNVQVGVHVGPVIATPNIGYVKPRLSIVSRHALLTERLGATSLPGRVQVSERAYRLSRRVFRFASGFPVSDVVHQSPDWADLAGGSMTYFVDPRTTRTNESLGDGDLGPETGNAAVQMEDLEEIVKLFEFPGNDDDWQLNKLHLMARTYSDGRLAKQVRKRGLSDEKNADFGTFLADSERQALICNVEYLEPSLKSGTMRFKDHYIEKLYQDWVKTDNHRLKLSLDSFRLMSTAAIMGMGGHTILFLLQSFLLFFEFHRDGRSLNDLHIIELFVFTIIVVVCIILLLFRQESNSLAKSRKFLHLISFTLIVYPTFHISFLLFFCKDRLFVIGQSWVMYQLALLINLYSFALPHLIGFLTLCSAFLMQMSVITYAAWIDRDVLLAQLPMETRSTDAIEYWIQQIHICYLLTTFLSIMTIQRDHFFIDRCKFFHAHAVDTGNSELKEVLGRIDQLLASLLPRAVCSRILQQSRGTSGRLVSLRPTQGLPGRCFDNYWSVRDNIAVACVKIGHLDRSVNLDSMDAVKRLDAVWSRVDQLITQSSRSHYFEKLLPADPGQYLVVSGLWLPQTRISQRSPSLSNVVAAAWTALADACLLAIRIVQDDVEAKRAADDRLALRVGLDIGLVAAGVVGLLRPTFGVWGRPLERAEALAATGGDGQLWLAADRCSLLGARYEFVEAGEIRVPFEESDRLVTYACRKKAGLPIIE